MKFLIGLTLLLGSSLAIGDSFNCSGSGPCLDCPSTTVQCLIFGSVSGATQCETIADGYSITCKVTQGDTVIAETTRNCNCQGNGPDDPGEGEFCDPADPLWWVFCNPFPVI